MKYESCELYHNMLHWELPPHAETSAYEYYAQSSKEAAVYCTVYQVI